MNTDYEGGTTYSYSTKPEAIPYFLNNLHKYMIKTVSCGDNFSIAVSNIGQVFGWGDNTFSQLAIDNSTSNSVHQSESGNNFFSYEPVKIKCFQNSKHIFEGINVEE